MERDRMDRVQVCAALNECLSYVDDLPSLRYDIMRKAKGEIVVKKKLSVGLILAIVLLLVAVTALAIVHFHEYAGRIADMESEKGYYDTWPTQDRIALVQMLVESGELPRDDRVKTLLLGTLDDAAASALATEIIIDWGPVREDAITLISILETVKGPMGHWPPEDKAWYTQLLREKGMLGFDADDGPTPIMPMEEGLSQAEAERIASHAIVEAYDFDSAALAAYKVGAELYTIPNLNTDAKWLITFYPPATDGGFKAEFAYYAVIDPQTGEVTSDPQAGYELPSQQVAKMGISPQQQRERAALYDTKGHHFYWTHEERAVYLPELFGMPDSEAIPEDMAKRLAREIAQNHEQIIPAKLEGYDTIAMYCPLSEYYPAAAADVWLIVLNDEDPEAGPYGTIYGQITMLLDYRTGELVTVFGFGDAFIFKEAGQ